MVTIPAAAWRGGPVARALTMGAAVGVCLGVLAWLDSGLWITGVIVTIVVGTWYGVWMQRRMTRYWPAARDLTGAERAAVARATRRGEPIADPRLGPAVQGYADGLRAAAEDARPYRWVLPVVLIVAIAAAVWDVVNGTWGNVAVSVIYVAALGVEVLWWPGRRRLLLANADRAVAGARAGGAG